MSTRSDVDGGRASSAGKLLIGYLQASASNNESLTVQMEVIRDACMRKVRRAADIIWIVEATTADAPDGGSRPGLSLLQELIASRKVRLLVAYECRSMLLLPRAWRELLDCLEESGTQFVSIRELVNNRRDLAKLVEWTERRSPGELPVQWQRYPQGKQPKLGPRIVEMMRLRAQGLSNQDISKVLGINANYVYISLRSALRRLGAKSAADAMAMLGLLSQSSDPQRSRERLAESAASASPKSARPLSQEHIRLLTLLAGGLTIYQAAVHLEIDPEWAQTLRRQAYLWLGVTRLDDAVAAAGVEAPLKKPVRPKLVRQTSRRSNDDVRRRILGLIGAAFEEVLAAEGITRPSPLGECWPDQLWLFRRLRTGEYFFLVLPKQLNCLVCLSNMRSAEAFLDALRDSRRECAEGLALTGASFDEARNIARSNANAQALVLLDDPDNPIIHYVR